MSKKRQHKSDDKDLTTFTVTMRDTAEAHPNLKHLGMYGKPGLPFDKRHFDILEQQCRENKWEYERIVLNELLPLEHREKVGELAELFIMPNGIDQVTNEANKLNGLPTDAKAADDIREFLSKLTFDTKIINHKRLCRRLAQQGCRVVPDVRKKGENDMGHIYDFHNVPHYCSIKSYLATLFEMDEICDDVGEINKYTNTVRCPWKSGVSPHGDRESKRVCAGRFGADLDLGFQWFHECMPYGERFTRRLKHGTLYFMGKKTSGADWMCSSLWTLRHFAGQGPRFAPSIAEMKVARKKKQNATKKIQKTLQRPTKNADDDEATESD